MRLHRLLLHAVGPFAAEQVIDFDRLSAGGLFLLDGPTGVGKSTILDALTFALYGGLASESGDPARLRSHFAGPHEQPEAQLEFSVRGQRHRVTRSPEYRRPKRRGAGETTEKSCVHLERLAADGRWESRSHAKDEVGTLITELVGLTRQQFRQVVLLPQGEFATFLRADDDERRSVLGRLFGTELYGCITSGLQSRAAQALRVRQAAEAQLQQRLAAAQEAAGADPAGQSDVIGSASREGVDRLADTEALLIRRERAAGLLVAAADADREYALAAHRESASIVGCVAERQDVLAAISGAESQRSEQAALHDCLARARRAAPLAGLLGMVDDTLLSVAERRDAVAAVGREQVTATHLDGAGADALSEQAAASRTTVGELQHLVAIEAQIEALSRNIVAKRVEVEGLRARRQAVQRRAESLPMELSTADAEAQSASATAAQAGVTRTLLASEQVRAAAAESVGGLEQRVVDLRRSRRDARRELDAAEDTHALLSDRRLTDLQGQLAASLVSGDPCLVCGSPEHPAPAGRGQVGVTSADLTAAAADRDHARVRLDGVVAALVGAEAELRQAQALAGDRTPTQWQQRTSELEATADAAEAAQASLAELRKRVSDLSGEQREVASLVIDLESRLAAAEAQLAHDERDLETMAGEVGRARAGHPSVRSRVEYLAAEAERLAGLSIAVRDLHDALRESSRAADRATDEATAAGFAGLAQARSALLPAPEIERLHHEIERWEQVLAQATARLAAPELRAVADITAEEASARLARAAGEVERDERRLNEARGEQVVAQRQRERFANRLAEARECLTDMERASDQHEQVSHLDLYARGMAGSPRMTLVTFVLRYWFEEVVAAANVRLEEMSAGKYQLLRIDEAARRGTRVGLGLSVLDRHTGHVRSPATLSGGETFYTSLALALGLADVVVAQAGGAQLDTLFIDEGFGSLDPDTLDDVMGVIDDLRGNGRVVGIVSHVPELKDRIAERLTIRRERPDGPSQVVVVA